MACSDEVDPNMALRKPNVEMLLEGERLDQAKAIMDSLVLTENHVKEVMKIFQKEMLLGLSYDVTQRKQTSLQMENTYVRSLLDGTEEGDFLALDLGGTNFRVLLVQMIEGKCESISRKYNLTTETLNGPAKGVFDHLADSIYKFMNEQNILQKRLPLGFTFSFPMTQESIKSGILVTWTKSFACPDGVGMDAVKMLENSISKHNMKVDVVAVLNDTTGTLMAGSYLDHTCQIGLIMGTGCNAAYLEDVYKVDKWQAHQNGHKHVVIDTECGAFGDDGSLDFIKTKFDRTIDQHSNHVGSFTFEKLFAGHYLGDLGRLVLLDLAEQGLIFDGLDYGKLRQWKLIKAKHISDVQRDSTDDISHTVELLKTLGLEDEATPEDISVIRYMCSALAIRGAQLVSATISTLCNHMGKKTMTVAIDGTLYECHPELHNMMTAWCAELAPNTKTRFILATDGSGRGAAFVAAVAVKESDAQYDRL